MLGYGSIAPRYPFEMPRAMANAGFSTHSFGKDHFNWCVGRRRERARARFPLITGCRLAAQGPQQDMG